MDFVKDPKSPSSTELRKLNLAETAQSGSHLALQNGLLSLAELDSTAPNLLPHSPDSNPRVYLPYEYDPYATCPCWLAFLSEVLEGDADRIAVLQEWMGYSLVFDNPEQDFMVLVGEGSDGMCVVEDVWIDLVDQQAASTVSLAKFDNRLAIYREVGKIVNIGDTPGELTRAAENTLEALVGPDRLTFESGWGFRVVEPGPIVAVILTSNPVAFTDASTGIALRAKYLPFHVDISAHQQDEDLVETFKTEMPGILNWALAGYRRLKANGRFTTSAACEAAANRFRQHDNG
jgi:putative DNA primase/helicase